MGIMSEDNKNNKDHNFHNFSLIQVSSSSYSDQVPVIPVFPVFILVLFFFLVPFSFSQGPYFIDSCGYNITDAGEYFINVSVIDLNDSITSTGIFYCINISVSDVVLDGNGSLINVSSGYWGILVVNDTEIKNITIKNLTINTSISLPNNFDAISFSSGNISDISLFDIIIKINSSYFSSSGGIYFSSSSISNISFSNLTISSSSSDYSYGISFVSSSTISNISFSNLNISSSSSLDDSHGIYFSSFSISNVSFSNLTISSSSDSSTGIYFSSSSSISNIFFSNLNINSSSSSLPSYGIYFDWGSISNISFSNLNISSSSSNYSYGIYFYSSNNANNEFSDINISSTNIFTNSFDISSNSFGLYVERPIWTIGSLNFLNLIISDSQFTSNISINSYPIFFNNTDEISNITILNTNISNYSNGIFFNPNNNGSNIKIKDSIIENILDNNGALRFINITNITLENTIIRNVRSYALAIFNSNDTTSNGLYLANTTGILLKNNGTTNMTNISLNVIFDNPLGGFINYSNITLKINVIEAGNNTTISWAIGNETINDGGNVIPSFFNKAIEINSTNITINELTFYYTATEEAAVVGSSGNVILQIWKFNGSDWINLSSNQSFAERKVSLYDFEAGSIYELFLMGKIVEEKIEEERLKEMKIEKEFICPNNVLRIKVSDRNNDEPLENVRVVLSLRDSIFSESKETDENGTAMFIIKREGIYDIITHKNGYRSEGRTMEIMLCEIKEEKPKERPIEEKEEKEEKVEKKEIVEEKNITEKIANVLNIETPSEAFINDNIAIIAKWENGTIAKNIKIKVYYFNELIETLTTDENGKAVFIPKKEGVYSFISDYTLLKSANLIVKAKSEIIKWPKKEIEKEQKVEEKTQIKKEERKDETEKIIVITVTVVAILALLGYYWLVIKKRI